MSQSVLRDTVNKILDGEQYADPTSIAQETLRLLPDSELRPALAEILPEWVRVQITRRRGQQPREDSPGGQSVGDNHRAGAAGGSNPDPAYSVWTTSFQSWGDKLRNERVSVGPNATDWKFFRDLTHADCFYNEAESLKLAAANAAKAEKWNRTERAMREYEVERAGDLSDEVLTDIWK